MLKPQLYIHIRFDTCLVIDSWIFWMVKAINLWEISFIFHMPRLHIFFCFAHWLTLTFQPDFIFNEFPLTRCLTLVCFAQITIGLKFSELFNWKHTEGLFIAPVVAHDKSENDLATKFFQTSDYTLAYPYLEGVILHLWNNLIVNFLFVPARVCIVCINKNFHFRSV